MTFWPVTGHLASRSAGLGEHGQAHGDESHEGGDEALPPLIWEDFEQALKRNQVCL